MTSHYSLPPTDWNSTDRRNSGVLGFRATSPRISTPPPSSSRGGGGGGATMFYSPLSRWDVSHNESVGSQGTCGFGSKSPRASHIPAHHQGGSGSVAPLESWIRSHQQASAVFRSNTPRHSHITAPVYARSSPRSSSSHAPTSTPSKTEQRGAPMSNTPVLTQWVKDPVRQSSSFAASSRPHRHSYIPSPGRGGAASAPTSAPVAVGGVTSYAPLDDWGQGKVRGHPSAGMISKAPRHSYIPKQ
ncbi:Hypothetical protein, putative [Bodo saltans]|uniref:Uncharacterized protein n=1 Tax=Bodo saltans TaxID=75058 RepID=A0A0S4IK70_BODSA|nr:Hypothetical protein, putative [Bodo saltans]|eukprot:CUE64054.1 Hypothetical protein, putative [Bodo saltans]